MKQAKTIIIVVVIAALIGGYYFYLSNKAQQKEDDVQATAVQEVLMKNLETNYPPTPKEVVRYYSDISKCLYNEEYTDEQFEQMVDKMLALYDDELLEQNPREQYIEDLRADVILFETNGYTIESYSTSASTDVVFDKIDGREWAKLYCMYSIRTSKGVSSSQEVYELRKDLETGHWKIYGFQMAVPKE